MPTVLKLFLSVLTVLAFLYLVTTGKGIMNEPSDTAVLLGVTIVFCAFVVLFYGLKLIWYKSIKVTQDKKEGK